MRLHSVVGAITNSSSELFMVRGSLPAARREFEDLWDAWREDLPVDDAWRDFPLGDFLSASEGWTSSDGRDLEVLGLAYGLPRGFREMVRASVLGHSEYLDG